MNSKACYNGIINLFKEPGVLSNSTLNQLKKRLGVHKAGFAGILDNFASGVLPVGINRGTKLIKYLHLLPKEYVAELFLGASTDTLDVTGNPVALPGFSGDKSEIQKILPEFIGSYDQRPPEYSSKKINGKRASDLTRKGEKVELRAVPVTIHSLEILDWVDVSEGDVLCPDWYHSGRAAIMKFRTLCLTGTYIRSLGRDIATRSGTAGFLKSLVRTKVGRFPIEESVRISELDLEKHLIKPAESLDFLPSVGIKATAMTRLKNGRTLVPDDFNCDNLQNGIFLAMFEGLLAAVLENKDGQFGTLDVFYTES